MYQFNSICKQINFCYFYRKHDFYNFIYKNIKIQSKFINIKKKSKNEFFTKLITKIFESLLPFDFKKIY